MDLTDAIEATLEKERMINARRLSPTRNFLSGAVGGMFACFVGQPLDMIKVRLQIANVKPGQSPPFTGPIDCLTKIVKVEGVRGLFRGMLAPITMTTPGTALAFFSLSLGKRLQLDNPEQEPTLLQYAKAGVFSAWITSFLSSPAERVKCLLQVHSYSGLGKRTGPLYVLKDIYQKEGLRGIYRGLCTAVLMNSVGNASWYLTYEGLLRALRPRDSTRDDVTLTSIIFSGGAAGLAFWIGAFPIDVVKTRYQVSPAGLYPRGGRDVLKEILRNEGIKALYRGYVPALIRAPIVSIALFIGYESTLKTLNRIAP